MKLTHPDSKVTVEAKEEHADAYTSQGWVAEAESSTDDKKK